MRAELAVRDALVRTRTRYIALAKALVRRDGLRVPTSASAWVPTRIAELDLSPTLTTELAPLFAVFAPLNAQIAVADARIEAFVDEDPIAARLTTAPGVGPVTASAFVATIDDITRFRTAHELEAYLGVIPSERSSGEKRQLGPITKAGNGRMRWLLVDAAWTIMRSKSPNNAALRAWTVQIAQRRGKRIAAVALARRLAGILYAMWHARIEMTESGAASARISFTQHAVHRRRGIVGAVRSFVTTQMRRDHRVPHESANRRLSSASRIARTTDERATARAEKHLLGLTRAGASQKEVQSLRADELHQRFKVAGVCSPQCVKIFLPHVLMVITL